MLISGYGLNGKGNVVIVGIGRRLPETIQISMILRLEIIP